MNRVMKTSRWRSIMVGTVLSLALAPLAHAEGGDAAGMLKAMTDYVASQNNLSITYDSDIEVITSHLQKIQFTSSGQVQLSRPDKLRATRTGGYHDVEVVFDGKLVTINDKDAKHFAQIAPKERPIISLTCCATSTAWWHPAPTCCFHTPST
jgi:hypothetical protein